MKALTSNSYAQLLFLVDSKPLFLKTAEGKGLAVFNPIAQRYKKNTVHILSLRIFSEAFNQGS